MLYLVCAHPYSDQILYVFFLWMTLRKKVWQKLRFFLTAASATVTICEWKIFAEFHDICWGTSVMLQISAGEILHAKQV